MGGEELLTEENRVAEEVYLGLRARRGLAIHPDEVSQVETWESAGWAVVEGETASDHSLNGAVGEASQAIRVRLTPTGWLRLDSLAADLAAQRARPARAAVGPNPSHCYI
jgi:oxygen-independent coproporphyrinogen III oxidase